MDRSEERDRLYTYWQELPFTRDTSFENLSEMLSNPVRKFILTSLRDGVSDAYSQEHGLPRRHAFSVKELHRMYREGNSGKTTVQNFHFHMKALLETGVVQVISEILEERHYVKYYGRTSKMVENFNYEESLRYWKKARMDPLQRVIMQLHPEESEKRVEEVLDTYLRHLLDYYLKMYSWMETNYRAFYDSGMDLLQFTLMSASFSSFDDKLQESSREIARLLDLDQINEFPRYNQEKEL